MRPIDHSSQAPVRFRPGVTAPNKRGDAKRSKISPNCGPLSRIDLPRNDRGVGSQPLLSVRSRKLLGLHRFDPDRTEVVLPDLVARAGSIGEQLYKLARKSPKAGQGQRPLSLGKLFDLAAASIFGPGANQRVRYRTFEKKLEEHGLGAALQPMMAALPRDQLRELRSRGLSPKVLFRAGACALAAWRASPDPMNEAQLVRELTRDGRQRQIAGFLDAMSPGDRERLGKGELTGRVLAALWDAHASHRAHLGIIGAGMSGIAAANVAMDAGVGVVLLEAKDHPLGRVQSENIDGVPFEVGGAWVHNRFNNPLSDLARDLGYTLIPNEKFDFAILGGKASESAAVQLNHRVETLAMEWGKDDNHPLSERPTGTTELDHLAAEVLGPLEVARELNEISAKGVSSLVTENDDAIVKDGMGRMLSALAIGLPIRTNCPVERIEWGGAEVVAVANGERYSFDKLLITLPPSVLSSGAITFDPPLPAEIRDALMGFQMSSFEKILLRFDRNVFGTDKENVRGAGFDAQGHGFEVNLRIKGTNAATVLVGGDHAKAMLQKREEEALAYGLDQLAGLFGHEVYTSFVGGERTDWTHDPRALGAYAVPTIDGPKDAVETLSQPLDDKLHFAGEHLGAPGWRASIAGALQSGKRAAEQILENEALPRVG